MSSAQAGPSLKILPCPPAAHLCCCAQAASLVSRPCSSHTLALTLSSGFLFGKQLAMQDPAAPAQVTWAATAVLLQAAIGDPGLVQANLADHKLWPALLAACTPCSTPATVQHTQLLTHLGPSSIALQGFHVGPSMLPNSSVPASLADTELEERATTSPGSSAASASGDHTAAAEQAPPRQQHPDLAFDAPQHDNAASARGAAGDEQPSGHAAQQQQPTEQAQQEHNSNKPTLQQHSPAWLNVAAAERQVAEAGSAGHVAQLITLFLRTQPPQEGADSCGFASRQAFGVLLHCYARHSKAAAAGLKAPVWPVQAQKQRAQHGLLQHVAEAGELFSWQLLASKSTVNVCQRVYNGLVSSIPAC